MDIEEVRIKCLTATKSPFVLEGLKSPVKWWGWCREAFEYAKREDKPILVDVGAVWCHWCHVMDETTYSDPSTAELINRHFVPIKVDRDERPDIDRRLQEVAAMLTGQAGWPLTVFLTPEGDVIWAATYLPPVDQYGLPSMATVLKAVLEAYRERRGDIKALSEDVKRALAASRGGRGELDRSLVGDAVAHALSNFDDLYGGFGTAPKFPPIAPLLLLMYRAYYDGLSAVKNVVEKTATAMARGGMYDHLLGGFFRYSTDRAWIIPHYEKLLIDNAELAKVYVDAHRLLGAEEYRRVVEGIFRWVDAFMRREGGGYHSSQDADVEGEEGGYYRWSLEELKDLLGDLYPIAAEHFGLEEHRWPEGKATLYVRRTAQELAERHGPQVVEQLGEIYRRLSDARARRRPPFVDTTVISGWSCAMAEAELYAHRHLGLGNVQHALATLDFVEREMWSGGALWHSYREGAPTAPGVLDDYARCISAALEAYTATAEAKYLRWAVELGGAVLSKFSAPDGGFYDVETVEDLGILGVRLKPVLDTPNLSPNASAALALIKLHQAVGSRRYAQAVEEALKALIPSAHPLGAAGLYLALDFYTATPPKVVVLDEPGGTLHSAAVATWRPGAYVLPLTNDALTYVEDKAVREMAKGPAPAAYICTSAKCSLPIRDPDRLREAMATFGAEEYRLL